MRTVRAGEMEMMLESGMQIRDDILQEELSRAADDKMKNIVATIQRDQNAIIRNETSPVLVIQGVAGSGKTSIALHRIAFLLYRYKESLTARDLLIISPNKVFADYISNVLPELGEETIPEMGIEALAAELLEGKFRFQSFFEQVNRLLQKPDEEFIARMRFKASYDFLMRLNDYIGYLERENFAANDVQVRQSFVPVRFVRDKYLFYRHLPMFKRLTEVVREVTEKVRRDFGYELKAAEKNKLRSDIRRMYRSTSIRELYRAFYDWLERPDLFRYAAKTTFEYADVFPLIYLKMRLEGYGGYRRVKHLLVDEMQDYTPVQYAVLARLFPCNKTILGDARQSVNPYSSTTSEEILRVFSDADAVKLVKSYRSTWEIARFAQRISADEDLVAVERHGEEPQVRSFGSQDEEVDFVRREIAAFRESTHRTMGIICKTQRQAEKLYVGLIGNGDGAANGESADSGKKPIGENKASGGTPAGIGKPEIHLLSPGSAALSSGVNVTTAHLAKGLEFDRVVVPQVTAKNYATEIDKSMLYIACTRAMHRLVLSHTGQQSGFLQ
ncbi:MAG: helicase [Balneolaceae bacterium]|nr:MAG: helicase [Balneolaceae bacterium]